MKKLIFITIALVLGFSFESFAATGNANDGFQFIVVVIGFLLILVGLLTGTDYLKNNGRKIVYKGISLLRKMIIMIKDHLGKVKTKYFDLSYF